MDWSCTAVAVARRGGGGGGILAVFENDEIVDLSEDGDGGSGRGGGLGNGDLWSPTVDSGSDMELFLPWLLEKSGFVVLGGGGGGGFLPVGSAVAMTIAPKHIRAIMSPVAACLRLMHCRNLIIIL